MLLSALVSAVNGAVSKILTQDISAIELVFFRNILGVVLIGITFLRKKKMRMLAWCQTLLILK